jgi:hypothetical protein
MWQHTRQTIPGAALTVQWRHFLSLLLLLLPPLLPRLPADYKGCCQPCNCTAASRHLQGQQ